MNKGRSPTLALVILGCILTAVVACLVVLSESASFALAFPKQTPNPAPDQQASKSPDYPAAKQSKPGTKPVDWNALIPKIRAALKEGFPFEMIERRYSINIDSTDDLTGDGIPEALVTTGDVGAYTDYLALIRLEDGKPVAARFKTEDGKVGPYMFLAGASARHGVATILLPEKQSVYQGRYETSDTGQRFNSCSATAYRWNAETKIFEWNRDLSAELTKTYCERELKPLPQY